MRFRFVHFLIVAAMAGAIGVGVFYARSERLSDQLEQTLGYSGQKANAAKHAYAAAQVYGVARAMGLGGENALALVDMLGVANEYAERVVKFRKPDSAAELRKDLYNNRAGVLAAQWGEGHAPQVAVLEIVLRLADNGTLITERDDSPFDAGAVRDVDAPVRAARVWFAANKGAIDARVQAGLDSR